MPEADAFVKFWPTERPRRVAKNMFAVSMTDTLDVKVGLVKDQILAYK